MNQEILNNIIEKEVQKSSITSKDIPDLDLYMDQIMTLFDSHLANNKKNEDDKLLTKTMINNYSKSKVITQVKGKKYTKEQIIQMLMIYQLKNNLSIQEIKDYQLDINQYHDLFLLIASLSTLSYSLNNIAESIIEEK